MNINPEQHYLLPISGQELLAIAQLIDLAVKAGGMQVAETALACTRRLATAQVLPPMGESGQTAMNEPLGRAGPEPVEEVTAGDPPIDHALN